MPALADKEHEPGNGRPEVSLRRRFLSLPTLVSFVLAVAFLVFLVTRFEVNLASTWENIRRSHLGLYLLALVLHYTTFPFRGGRWCLLIRNAQRGSARGTSPRWWHCARLVLLGWFVNSIAWFRLGDAYRAYAYSEDTGASFSQTIGTILAERVLDVVLVFLMLVGAVVLLSLGRGQGPSLLILELAALLVAGGGVVLLMMVLLRGRLTRWLPRPLRSAYQRFHQGTLGSFRQLPLVLLLGLLGWLAEVGRLFLVLRALGLSLTAPMVLFVTLANALLTLVPVTPGGLGIVEPGITGLLLFSLAKEEAVSVALLDRSISYLSIVLFGALLFLLRLRGLAGRSRRAAALAEEQSKGT